jgi:hypothetical protein
MKRSTPKNRPACLQHGPGCDLKLAAGCVDVDPTSDPVKVPCERHGAWCDLRRATCKRRTCRCERPSDWTEHRADVYLAKGLPRDAALTRARADQAESEARYAHEHFPDGSPRPSHPTRVPVDLVDAAEKIREAKARVRARFDEDKPDTMETLIESGQSADHLWKAYGHAGIEVAREAGFPELAAEISAIDEESRAAHPVQTREDELAELVGEPEPELVEEKPSTTPFHHPGTFSPSFQVRKKRRPGRNEPRVLIPSLDDLDREWR